MSGVQVTYVNPLTWTDGELLRELRAALREPAVDEDFVRAARAAFYPAGGGRGPGAVATGTGGAGVVGRPPQPGEIRQLTDSGGHDSGSSYASLSCAWNRPGRAEEVTAWRLISPV